ncbi:hypothetical protein HBH56_137620 [Parastagonospora nodorum]|uniref:Uncharacterized protein n=1 Tax=Phaeosphaeria nodorum (strain SN15 / ATCC MYA-4574 / FGSC 10173) TaxID=321614 RepID=A0A7U2HV13_PHANO|nr:hypothetical protein HBH56_137620 [Parastagonospora nodorum]QRC91349.1 hypothetical protein JI435_008490 [Parastagonospora nodorum SN15]KAH3927891.1 hypothetical protein HBH54_142760 [Parastagonospora nodorum]KAH3982832.1 hypothetical protein HBH51_035370 [Parastagonospora nodorum]KAH4111467.1 hypothetical protein HBH46_003420 [Parastagonospora nodorum]
MPGHSSMQALPPFKPAATEAQVKAATESHDPEQVIRNLVDLSSYLISIDEHTKLFGAAGKHDPYTPSLKTLLNRLYAGVRTLSPLSSLTKDGARLRQDVSERLNKPVIERPLEDFEDLYYALLARLQDMAQMLTLRVTNGFNAPSEPVFENGPSIADLYDSLMSYWDMLNDPACARALDDAMRQFRVGVLYREINAELEAHVISFANAEELLAELFESKEFTEGIAWIASWSPAMIGAYLSEKYHVALRVQREEDERVEREKRKRMSFKKPLGSMIKQRSSERMRRGSAKQAHFVHQRGAVGYPTHQHVVNDHERIRQEQLHRDREWQLKSQRVSDYSNYLRGTASHDAQSIVRSVSGSSGQQTPETDGDEMEI